LISLFDSLLNAECDNAPRCNDKEAEREDEERKI
jgi:hypothetical protein